MLNKIISHCHSGNDALYQLIIRAIRSELNISTEKHGLKRVPPEEHNEARCAAMEIEDGARRLFVGRLAHFT